MSPSWLCAHRPTRDPFLDLGPEQPVILDRLVEYYRLLRTFEIEERIALGLCAQSQGTCPRRSTAWSLKVRLPGRRFREFWQMFSEAGAVVVASSCWSAASTITTTSGTIRTTPWNPSPTIAWGSIPTGGPPTRVDMLVRNLNDYDADGLLINSIKSCNSFRRSLVMMREIEKITGKLGAFVETDLVDYRVISPRRT